MSVEKIRWLQFPAAAAVKEDIYEPFSYEQSVDVRRLHESLADYAATPLVSLDGMAGAGGVKAVFVKDESPRFGLKAFKGLGGTYAMFRMICKELGLDPAATAFEDLLREPYAAKIHELVFITTTDGNHGKGVSWAAKLFGCKAHVFMPVGTVEVRAQAIRDAGNADVVITDMPYDACVNYTAALAEENGWLLIQDTSWDGYEDVPLWIMRGYTTLFYEAAAQLKKAGYSQPTHIFLQAGVGAMAGAVAACAMASFPEKKPVISIVEPKEVACFYESALCGDGKPHAATGSQETIMAGLNCASPCTIAWDIIKQCASYAFACNDAVTEHGMRILADPATGEKPVVAGESGAVTAGLLDHLLKDEKYQDLKKEMGLDENAVVLLINTEGDTDPDNYKKVLGK